MSFERDFVLSFERYKKLIEKRIDGLLRSYSEAKASVVKKDVGKLLDRMRMSAQRIGIKATIDIYKTQARKTEIALTLSGSTQKALPDSSSGLDAQKLRVSERDSIKSLSKLLLSDILRATNGFRKNVDFLFYLMTKAYSKVSSIQSWDMRDEETISKLLDQELILGASEGEIARLVRNHFIELMGEGKFININGRNYNIRKYSQLVARTRQRVIQTRATVDQCNKYQNDLVRFSIHMGACELCRPYEGKVYSLSGRDPKYPLLPAYPPIHPRCQHDIYPTSQEAIAEQGEVWKLNEEGAII